MRRRLISAAVAVLVVAGVGVGFLVLSASNGGQGESTGTPSGVGDLVVATHGDCETGGQVIAHYLDTGDPGGHPEVDQGYAQRRAEILQQPNDARSGLIRAAADDYITQCDRRETKAEQDAAQQQAAEAQQAQAAQAAADRQALYASTCQAHGGSIPRSTCVVSYPGWSDQPLPLNSDGTWDQAQANLNRGDCASNARDAATAASEGHPWSVQPQYHEDTGVCARGTP